MSAGNPADLRLQSIAERIRDGDASAFEAFLDELWAPIVRYVGRMLGADDAQDVAQEAFVRVWEQRAGLRPSSSIRAYVYQIARNLALNETKRRGSQGRLATRLSAEIPPPAPTPGSDLDRTELREVVGAAIDGLPPRRREAFVLAHVDGLLYREVAEVMDISPQSVANQISAALADLRAALHPYVQVAETASDRQLG